MEKLKKKVEESVIDKLEELKVKEIERMEEDPTYGGPWKNIEPEHLTPEVRALYDLFEKGQLDVTRDKFQEVNDKIEKMKNGDIKNSNLGFLHWIDDKIDTALSAKALEEERQKE